MCVYLYTHKYTYKCMYACMYVCMYVPIYPSILAYCLYQIWPAFTPWMHKHAHGYRNISHPYITSLVYKCVQKNKSGIYKHVFTYMWRGGSSAIIHVLVCVCVHTRNIYVYIYIYSYTHTYKYTYVYIYIYTHTHIHTVKSIWRKQAYGQKYVQSVYTYICTIKCVIHKYTLTHMYKRQKHTPPHRCTGIYTSYINIHTCVHAYTHAHTHTWPTDKYHSPCCRAWAVARPLSQPATWRLRAAHSPRRCRGRRRHTATTHTPIPPISTSRAHPTACPPLSLPPRDTTGQTFITVTWPSTVTWPVKTPSELANLADSAWKQSKPQRRLAWSGPDEAERPKGRANLYPYLSIYPSIHINCFISAYPYPYKSMMVYMYTYIHTYINRKHANIHLRKQQFI